VIIFNYTSSLQVKISQKVLGGYFFDSHCISSFTQLRVIVRLHGVMKPMTTYNDNTRK